MEKTDSSGKIVPANSEPTRDGDFSPNYKSRKWILTLVTMLGATGLLFGGVIQESSWVTVIISCIAAYNGANVLSKKYSGVQR